MTGATACGVAAMFSPPPACDRCLCGTGPHVAPLFGNGTYGIPAATPPGGLFRRPRRGAPYEARPARGATGATLRAGAPMAIRSSPFREALAAQRLPVLDGLRAVAAFTVIVYHFGNNAVPGE